MSTISCALLSFFYCLVLLAAQPDLRDIQTNCDYDDQADNYTYTSTYHSNLVTVLSSLHSATINYHYGFYNMSYGQDPDRVTAICLCRGDIVNSYYCRSCLNYTTMYVLDNCPNLKEAIVYNDFCMVRYSDKLVYGLYEKPNYFLQFNNSNYVKEANFNETVNDLLQNLAKKAAAGDSLLKFAASSVPIMLEETTSLYGLVQCTPDLSEEDCNNCLQKAILEINECCGNINGARVIKPSCYIRYEVYLFYNGASLNSLPPSFPPPPSSQGDSGGSKAVLVKIFVLITFTVLIPLCLVGYYLIRKRRKTVSRKAILRNNFGEESSKLKTLHQFCYATIEAATNRFSEENKIGKGGFGEVYKGILLDGQEIAVKRLSKSSIQGTSEFKNEVLSIAKLQHKNIVTLLGFCLEEQERILIYEYVPNKSLDFFLFDFERRQLLNWSEYLKIMRGIAQGLFYMHEHSRLKVIHRDLKPSNVLLDSRINPKISDFGMAKIIEIDEEHVNTNRIVGTFGYMAPEYIMYGKFSEKSDVFSFGVIILEILSGKRNAKSYESHLLTHVWKQWNNGTPIQALDSFLKESCSRTEAIKCEQIGLLCVQKNAEDRPTIAQIVSYLGNLSMELPSPSEPAFFMSSDDATTGLRSGFDRASLGSNHKVSNEMSESELLPR